MAEERNEMSPGEPAGTDEIKSEIERTRVEMSETLGEIQERLRPDHLIQQAKDTVTEAATEKVRNIMDSNVAGYVRSHPVQMALLAGGITWWVLRRSDRSGEWEGASEGWSGDSEAYGETGTVRETVGEYASAARETVGEYASAARETVGEYAGSARETARRATARVTSAAETARLTAGRRLRQASTSVDDWVHEYPLAAGAIAVAVGAAIGLSVPRTELEDRTMGTTRDRAWQTASQKAREVKDDVTKRVHDVAESVVDATAPAAGAGSRPPSTDPRLGRA